MKQRFGQGVPRLSASLLLWSYALAIVAVGCLPRLPALSGWLVAAAVLLALGVASVRLSRALLVLLPILLALVLGGSWALWRNHQALDQRLPLSAHGEDFVVQLRVDSLPQLRSAASAFKPGGGERYDLRFSAQVLGQIAGRDVAPALGGQTLDLTWYNADRQTRDALRAGSHWQLALRLKRPRGSANPHTFDYEAWLLQRGVYATGYVREDDYSPRHLLGGGGLPALRERLRGLLSAPGLENSALLCALLLGDRSGLDSDTQQLLRETGTAHLLAISGLHVGLVAGFFLLLGGWLARAAGMVAGVNPSWIATLCGLGGALVYTLLAGAPLSAQRALVMTAVLLLAWQWRRRISVGFAFALALALVLTLQPLAFLGPGFWLSFVAVAALLLSFRGRLHIASQGCDDGEPASLARKLQAWMFGMLRSQWVIVLALLLPSLLFFYGFSISGFLLNLVAIPWLGLLVLPPLLLGALLGNTAAGGGLLAFADWQLEELMAFLHTAHSSLPAWQTLAPPLTAAGVTLAAAAVLLLLLPRGLPGRGLGWLFPLALLAPYLPGDSGEPDQLRVTVLDVGQGLAVVLRTGQTQLLYDSGPVSPSGWSAGGRIIAPYLLGEGIFGLDTAVISHGDSDHAGGLPGLVETLPLVRIRAPGALAGNIGRDASGVVESGPCIGGARELLGDLQINWLWPDTEAISGDDNDHSCVALIEWRGRRILLAGDISYRVERLLAQRYREFPPVDLLVAPHHGSRSSSSQAFIDWVAPKAVIFSAGFRHHFGHPHPDVVARYSNAGARLFNTADSGAVTFSWSDEGSEPLIIEARNGPRFWFHPPEIQRLSSLSAN